MRIDQKFELATSLMNAGTQSILDVGCRDCGLKRAVLDGVRYTGLDLIDGPGVDVIGNIEDGIPLPDHSFDAVVALDVLEHTDRIWFVFDELVRVARKQVIVLMPNIYYWRHRITFLLGNEMGKYVLTPSPILDRHRWLTSYNSANRFFHEQAKRKGLTTIEHAVSGSKWTRRIDSAMPLNLGAYACLHVMEKR